MDVQSPSGSDTQWAEILRKAGIAMQGRTVGVWEAGGDGRLRPLATSVGRALPAAAGDELLAALNTWNIELTTGRRWIASRLDEAGRWCIAPVRTEPPGPPPTDLERRGRERMTLELAGLCIGLIEGPGMRFLEELRRNQQELEDFFERATVGLHWAGPDGTIQRVNQGELDMLGYPREEYVGRNVAEFHLDPQVADDIQKRLAAGERLNNVEARLRHNDGSVRHVLISADGRFEEGRLVHSRHVTRDVTEMKWAETLLLHTSLHDPLTGLPNRILFFERVGEALSRARRDLTYRFAVVYVDCDNFKTVNDSLGHSVGDQLLNGIAHRLHTCVRPGDVVARLGGDEFTLLLEDVADPADAQRVAERILTTLGSPFDLEGREVFATVSLGVALSALGYERPEDLLRDADTAMYGAKAAGRARFQLFEIAMRDRARARASLGIDLRRAVERDEFLLLFQPIVELATGRVHAFEALLRWRHPRLGIVPPGDFIPLAEETGLIVPIGRWVLREACRQTRNWRRALPGADAIHVSVNLSARQLTHPTFVEEVTTVLRDEGLRPTRLCLEITESAIMERPESSGALLERLRWLGVGLHMDDFGTGYSSLSYLQRFPVDTIKIDGSFVRRMGARRTDLEVVRTIIGLAQNLRLGVIAEGVETALQRDRLLAFGCTLGQGFHFAEPLEPPAAAELLATGGQRLA